MLRPSIITGTVIAAVASPPTAPAQACIQDAAGRVICGPHLYRGQYYDQYDRGAAWPFNYCPSGTVAGNYGECVRWRLTLDAKCPPNMWVVDGACRPYGN